MGTVVAGGNEIGECDLQGDRHQQAEMSLCQDKGICHAFGSDQVSHANIGKHRLGESAEIDRAIAGSEASECCNGSPLILKLTVVVVLDDRGSRVVGKLKQFEPSAHRHQTPGRVLMRWRDEYDPGR